MNRYTIKYHPKNGGKEQQVDAKTIKEAEDLFEIIGKKDATSKSIYDNAKQKDIKMVVY